MSAAVQGAKNQWRLNVGSNPAGQTLCSGGEPRREATTEELTSVYCGNGALAASRVFGDPRMERVVSLKLKIVPAEEALAALSRASGLPLEVGGSVRSLKAMVLVGGRRLLSPLRRRPAAPALRLLAASRA